jgi:hypothetical protein
MPLQQRATHAAGDYGQLSFTSTWLTLNQVGTAKVTAALTAVVRSSVAT